MPQSDQKSTSTGKGPQLNARVTQRMEIAPGLIILQVAPDGWELPEFRPGQFSVLGLPGSAPRSAGSDPDQEPVEPDKLIRRAYSITSSSVARQYLEFYITLVSSGALTPRLFHLKVGDPLSLGQKVTGMFTLDSVGDDQNVLLFATGTGLAPYMSMIRTTLAENTKRRVAVIHGAYHSWDLGYRSELMTLERVCPHFDYVPVVSDPQDEVTPWTGRAGFCQHQWTAGVIDELWGFRPTPENTHVFLCGHPGMLEAMLELLAKDGFREHTKKSPGQVHLEKYW